MGLTKRRLVILAAGACVVAVAVAAMLGWWKVTVVIVAALQAGGVVLAVDHRSRGATSREVRKVLATTRDLSRRLDNVGTRLTSVSEMARLEANDHLDAVERDLTALGKAVDAVEQAQRVTGAELTAVDAGVGAVGDAVGELGGQLSEATQNLEAAYQDLEQKRVEADKHQISSNLRQVRQVEALLQLFGRFTPRAAMPSSGGWALDATGLVTLLEVVDRRRPGTIVEFGSGTSSVWLGYALGRLGAGRLISVDHDEHYAAATRALITAHGLDDVVEVRHAPLTDAGLAGHDTPWYDSSVLADVTDIDLLIIDGPPKKTGPFARYPALPKLADSLSARVVVAVDDAKRPDERAMVERWQEQFGDLRDEVIPPGDTLRILVRDGSAIDQAAN